MTDRAKAMPHNQWRIQQLKTKIGLPFAEYNRYDDGIRTRCDRYIADREKYRAETSRRNSLLIPVTYPKYRTSCRWINEELAWWKRLSSEECEKPRNRWLIGLLKGPSGNTLSRILFPRRRFRDFPLPLQKRSFTLFCRNRKWSPRDHSKK